jgi:hypothetical protein
MTSFKVDFETNEPPECLNENEDCQGKVEWWTVGDSIKAWPRCDYHGEQRMKQYEGSLEQESRSDIAPNWFDPADAGETW